MWSMAYPLEGKPEFVNRTALNPIAIQEAEFDFREYNNDQDVQDLSDQIVYQDWQLTADQKKIGMPFARLSRAVPGSSESKGAALS